MRHLQRKILKYNVKKDLKAIKTIKKPLKGISCQGNMDMFFLFHENFSDIWSKNY